MSLQARAAKLWEEPSSASVVRPSCLPPKLEWQARKANDARNCRWVAREKSSNGYGSFAALRPACKAILYHPASACLDVTLPMMLPSAEHCRTHAGLPCRCC